MLLEILVRTSFIGGLRGKKITTKIPLLLFLQTYKEDGSLHSHVSVDVPAGMSFVVSEDNEEHGSIPVFCSQATYFFLDGFIDGMKPQQRIVYQQTSLTEVKFNQHFFVE